MQTIDILRDERVQLVPVFQIDERPVAGIGFGSTGRGVELRPPGPLAQLAIRQVMLEGGHLLGFRIAGPHPFGPTKIRDAGFGGDARPGQDHDPIGSREHPAGV
jgi:hypothetical protein